MVEQVRVLYRRVKDVVRMLELCMIKQPNDVFNVCSGKTVSVNQMSQWVAEALGKEHIGLDHKPASELWDRYPEMFQGSYPLDKSLVAKETTRYSKGSFEKGRENIRLETTYRYGIIS